MIRFKLLLKKNAFDNDRGIAPPAYGLGVGAAGVSSPHTPIEIFQWGAFSGQTNKAGVH